MKSINYYGMKYIYSVPFIIPEKVGLLKNNI